ncbi:MAG: SDR family oxidoreductase [Eudoraea sp.]|nr:SDR family oxidoreductase [Eudoraea sp.]
MILVTGGTGLVGAHLLLKLAQEETELRATFRPESNLGRVKKLFIAEHPEGESLFNNIAWVEADLNDIPKLEKAFKGVSRVYHCAALISFDPRDFWELKRVNVRGTANLVNLCIASGIEKLCYVSSIAALSNNTAEEQITEETESQGASNVYGLSKYLAELEVWRGAQEGVPVVVVNPGVIIGTGFWEQGSGSLFKLGAKGLKFYPPGGTGFVTVKDVVDVMVGLMNSGIMGERYILVERNLTYKDFFHYLAEGFTLKIPRKELKNWQLEMLWRLDWLRSVLGGKGRKLTRDGVKSLQSPVYYSNDKIKNALSYQFETIPEAISRCCQAYIEDTGFTS